MAQFRDPEADLQRHAAALHSLALALLRDRQAAEDAVQDAFVDVLRRPQSVRSPAGWLAAAVRSFARQRHRAEARRRARERIAARPEAVPGAVAMAARRELLHRLVEAVHALDEPYRETVWQRYFEELPPAAIAARAEVPVATVKSRLQRGLAQLRARLDRDCGEDDWRKGLATAFGIAGGVQIATVAAEGVLFMGTLTKVLFGGAAVVAAIAALWWAESGSPAPMQRQVGTATSPPAAIAADRAIGSGRRTELEREAAGSPGLKASAADEPSLRVRIVWASDRSPAGGVAVRAVPHAHLAMATMWPRSPTDEHGEVVFRDLPEGAVRVSTDRDPAEKHDVRMKRGEQTSAVVVLDDARILRGTVLDPVRRPVEGATIEIGSANQWSMQPMAVSAADGAFEIKGVPTLFTVGAVAARHGPSEVVRVDFKGGTERSVNLVLQGQGGRLEVEVVDPEGRPGVGAFVRVGIQGVNLGNREVEPRFAPIERVTGPAGSVVVDGVPAGTVDVGVNLEGCAPWIEPVSVAPRDEGKVVARLRRGVCVEGRVLDEKGEPAARAAVTTGRDWEVSYRCDVTDESGRYRLTGIQPGEFEVTAIHGELGRRKETVLAGDGETRQLDLRLQVGGVIRVSVKDGSGKPVASAVVEALGRRSFPSGTTGADGALRIPNCPEEGFQEIVVLDNSRRWVRGRVYRVKVGQTVDITVELSAYSAAVVGHVVDAEGGKPAFGYMVEDIALSRNEWMTPVAAGEGIFEQRGMPAGRFQVVIEAEGYKRWVSEPFDVGEGGRWDLGTVTLQRHHR